MQLHFLKHWDIFRYYCCSLVLTSAEHLIVKAFIFLVWTILSDFFFSAVTSVKNQSPSTISVLPIYLENFSWLKRSLQRKLCADDPPAPWECKKLIESGKIIGTSLEATLALPGSTSSKSTLHRWLLTLTPTISRTRSGLSLKFGSSIYGAFTEKKRKILVECLIATLMKKRHIDSKTVLVLACCLRH